MGAQPRPKAATYTTAPAGSLTLTSRETAAHLRIGITTVKRLIADGDIPSVMVGGQRRVIRARLEEYIAGREVAPGALGNGRRTAEVTGA